MDQKEQLEMLVPMENQESTGQWENREMLG